MTAQEQKAIAEVVGDSKAKEIKKALEKSKKSSKKEKKPRVTIDGVTKELLETTKGGITLDALAKTLSSRFPSHDPVVLKHTTKRRLHGYLKNKFGVTIKKDDNGKYSIVTKTSKTTSKKAKNGNDKKVA